MVTMECVYCGRAYEGSGDIVVKAAYRHRCARRKGITRRLFIIVRVDE